MVAQTCNPSAQETEVQVQGQTRLHNAICPTNKQTNPMQ